MTLWRRLVIIGTLLLLPLHSLQGQTPAQVAPVTAAILARYDTCRVIILGERHKQLHTMPQSVLETAKDLTLALIQAGRLSSEDVQDTLQKTHTTLLTLKAQEEAGNITAVSAATAETASMDWRKSITRHAVTCLECGQSFKQLSRRHLQEHGLDGGSYRVKYGIPHAQPLSARDTVARRRQVAQEIRPWEKAPMFRRTQAHDGKAPPEPEAEAAPDEIEAPTAAAPTPPKRQRQTTSKKTVRKKRSEG